MAFPIIPKKRSGATGNPSSLQLGELATNTATGELFLGGDAGVMLLNAPSAAGTTVTEHTGDGTTVAFTFTGYTSTADGAYLVSVGGIDQPPSKYSISSTAGGTLTFVEAPVAGELISIRAIVAGGGGGGSGDATSLQTVPISSTYPTIGQGLVFDGTNWAPASASTNATQIQNINVSITNPSAGDSLVYNSYTTEWVPSAPSTNATRLQGVDVTIAAPSAGDSLVYDSGPNQWRPQAIIPGAQLTTTAPLPLSSTALVGTGTTAARSDHRHAFPTAANVGALAATAAAGGDFAGNYPNPTLAAITTAQTVGSATQVPVVTVDAKGRVTGMTTAANPQGTVTSVTGGTGLTGGTITSTGTLAVSYGTTAGTAAQGNDSRLSDSRTPTGAAGGDLTGTYPNPTLAAVTTAQTAVGNSTTIPVITVNAKGQITALTTAAAAGGVALATTAPANLAATAAVGTGTTAARADHQHAFPTAIEVGAEPTITNLAVNKGGTGQTSYTDGQLLIGNTTGNTLAKATLTAGSGVTITNGPGTITIAATAAAPYSADYLIVAGGGGANSGGGGAGGMRTGTATLGPGTVYTITVGAGGAGSSGSTNAVSGSDSSIVSTSSIISLGGGRSGTRGSPDGTVGVSGGSGGGAGGNATISNTSIAGGSGTVGQGNNGGSTPGLSGSPSGGGGGAGANGVNGAANKGGDGGVGLQSPITGTSVYYAGGGGGYVTSGASGVGGLGGGGNGALGATSGVSGSVNTGGGGGAANSGVLLGGSGGSGTVVLSIPTNKYSTVFTGSPVVTTSGLNTILKFNSSGTYTA